MARKKSPIWTYFVVCEDTKYAKCNDYQEKVSRGGNSTKTYNTSNLVMHLKKHPDVYAEYEQKKQDEEQAQADTSTSNSSKAKQLTISDSYDRTRVWDINDARSRHIHQKIGEMIAFDFQPFSVVDDRGFRSLLNVLEPRYILPSRRYITDTVLPQIHKGIISKVEAELSLTNVESFSFTTDIWSSEISNDSMISLTAHWITDAFIRKSAVLHVQSFPDSHTGENICAMFDDMFERWKIKKENIHIIVSDNASNMVKAMKDGGYLNLGCFASHCK